MEKWIKGKIPRMGDIIRVRRKAGYCHFGIALSKDEVIHYSGISGDDIKHPENIKIRISPIDFFIKEDELEALDDWNSPFTAMQVIERAKGYLDSSYFRGKQYNFFTNNCEHFARYAYYGDATSDQVTNGLAAAAVLAGAVVTGTTIAVTSAIKKATNNRK